MRRLETRENMKEMNMKTRANSTKEMNMSRKESVVWEGNLSACYAYPSGQRAKLIRRGRVYFWVVDGAEARLGLRSDAEMFLESIPVDEGVL